MKKDCAGVTAFRFFSSEQELIFHQLWLSISGPTSASCHRIISFLGRSCHRNIVNQDGNGGFRKLDEKIHPIFLVGIFNCIIFGEIGPFFRFHVQQRYRITSEVAPFLPDSKSGLIITQRYFAVAFYLAYNRSSLLSSIGKLCANLSWINLILSGCWSVQIRTNNSWVSWTKQVDSSQKPEMALSWKDITTLDLSSTVAFSGAVNTLKDFHFSSRRVRENNYERWGCNSDWIQRVIYRTCFPWKSSNVANALAKMQVKRWFIRINNGFTRTIRYIRLNLPSGDGSHYLLNNNSAIVSVRGSSLKKHSTLLL